MAHKTRSLTKRLIFAYLIVGVVTVTTITAFFYFNLKSSLLERTFAQLSSINMLKKKNIEAKVQQAFEQVDGFIEDFRVSEFCNDSSCVDFHELPLISREFQFKELLIFDKNLNVLYQSKKEIKKLPLIKRSIKKFPSETSFLQDYTGTSEEHLSIYLITKVSMGENGVGYVVVRKPFETIQEILYQRTGMGKTGESYIVGSDLKMRSKSRFLRQKTPLSIEVKTPASINSTKGNIGSEILDDYRGVPVLSYYRPLEINNIQWGIITEIDVKEAMVPIYKSIYKLIWISVAVLLLLSLVTWIMATRITAPIKFLNRIITQLSKGRLPDESFETNSKDEIGQILSAMNELVKSLKHTAAFALEIGKGNFKTEYAPLSNHDTLGHSLQQMKDELIALNVQKSKLEKQSKIKLVQGQEKERARVAKELHDGIGPLLTTIKLHLKNSDVDKKIRKLIDDTITEVRRLSANLMPSVLIDFGIGPALENLINSFKEASNISFEYQNEITDPSLIDNDTNICIYRIAQESINNIAKHSGADKVKLSVTQFDDKVVFYIKDNGHGFNVSNYQYEKLSSNGIRNMEERVKVLDGKFFINSSENGTEIEVEIPLNNG